MKSIIQGAVLATAVVACLSLGVQAKPLNILTPSKTVALSDTGKMSKDKMKMDKKMEKKKMDKMKKSDKMSKKKMSKDTASKM